MYKHSPQSPIAPVILSPPGTQFWDPRAQCASCDQDRVVGLLSVDAKSYPWPDPGPGHLRADPESVPGADFWSNP